MRGIRGYIRNLSDGGGPPAGSVAVGATVTADTKAVDNTTHKTGALKFVHVSGGSGAQDKADQTGKFGWEMELSPGPLEVSITPHDPETEHRKRFWDESAQIGKAYLTDLERLGWAGGKDHLIWNAVFGGDNPTAAQWSNDPLATSLRGNWSVASFSAPGKVRIRQGVAMLGGVPFSIEMGDLEVPVAGETAQPSNTSGSDRWDLLCLRIDWNPASLEYGKQSFEFTPGIPGGGVPLLPANAGNYRRLPLHALKMPAGGDTYTAAQDLRRWADPGPPLASGAGLTSGTYNYNPGQDIGTAYGPSGLNTSLNASPLVLPTDRAWEGVLFWHAVMESGVVTDVYVTPSSVAIDANGLAVANTNYIHPVPGTDADVWVADQFSGNNLGSGSMMWPIYRIPSYAESGRAWTRLRFSFTLRASQGATVYRQYATIKMWPA